MPQIGRLVPLNTLCKQPLIRERLSWQEVKPGLDVELTAQQALSGVMRFGSSHLKASITVSR